MTRDEALVLGRSEGGKAVKEKTPPATCPRCSRPMTGRTWHSRFAWAIWGCMV